MKRLDKRIKTVSDLLTSDDVKGMLDYLVSQKDNIAEMVVIQMNREGIVRIHTTANTDETLLFLTRAQYHYLQQYTYWLSGADEDDTE